MKEAISRFIGDKILARWWMRYLIIPSVQAIPTAAAALMVGMGDKIIDGYPAPYVVFAAAIWALVTSAIVSALNDAVAIPATRYKRERSDLLRLIGYVQSIVGFKSGRFHKVSLELTGSLDPGKVFLTITKPDEQIREIVRFAQSFFCADRPADERIRLSLMHWNETRQCLEILSYFPDDKPPRDEASLFCDKSTLAGRAYFDETIIISENIAKDSRYRHFGRKDKGSMFCYPIHDPALNRVVMVVNVCSSEVKRFREKDVHALEIPMDIFAERLLLEYRLRKLKLRVGGNVDGGIETHLVEVR